jgi:putative colanic acid biosynthesis UDP-glucose lipid carrier transferase
VLLICDRADAATSVLNLLEAAPWTGMRVESVLSPAEFVQANVSGNIPATDEVWLCLQLSDQDNIKSALHMLRHSTANIRLLPDWFSMRLINHGISEVAGMPMLDLSASPITGSTALFKAIEDRVGAAIILSIIGLPMLLIALAVKLTSPGPVFYKQMRHGWNGEPIMVYKFRSMVVHQEADSKVTQATKGDSRITPLGALLRRTSLDELPQFINVLQGRMSTVGPRPHAVQHTEHYKELVPGYMLRHKVKPGITGWAQINGFRGETDTLYKMQTRVEYDLYYIENLSIGFDLKIIFITIFRGWMNRNAY